MPNWNCNDRSIDRQRLTRISDWMQQHVDQRRLAGLAVQVAHKGCVIFSEQAGHRDAEAGLAVSPDTLWRIYSMTKPITTLAALMLYEQGAFQLDQPVADFLPAFQELSVWKGLGHPLSATERIKRPVTIHDLMTHQSGLLYGNPNGNLLERSLTEAGLDFDSHIQTMAEAVSVLASFPLAFQPGQSWSYGLSTDVLGHLVEIISGKSLGDFFQSHIFAPLEMVDTGFIVPIEKIERLAVLYQQEGECFVRSADQRVATKSSALESGGAGLVSTMSDYQKFADLMLRRGAYQGGHLIGRKTFDLMVANHMGGDLASRGQAHFSETTMEGIGFGLGVSVMLDPTRAKIIGSVGEFAWGGWASPAFWVDPVEDMSVILMTQLTPSSAYTLRRQLRVLCYQALVNS